MAETRTNRLANETSPYLLQHADNPVDWYPWGEEAFARAREEDLPIFLSVGYSACHWCHVMAHESFEDDETAAIMNAHYVNVKVDREERPDVDEIYMNAVQMMTQQGGWPMSVFLTPEGKPFYGGTYFPPDSRYGRPGFRQVLLSISDFYHNRRSEVDRAIDGLMDGLDRISRLPGDDRALDPDLVSQAASKLARSFDERDGGFGSQPKFPNSMSLEVFLRNHAITGNGEDLARVTMTLDRMARGGIYDQVGGGFHRYSTDHRWLVPHFEKMLYDNALLAKLYFQAHQVTGDAGLLGIGREVLDYVLREMTTGEGGFCATQDADTEGEEGKFFVWTPAEVVDVLGRDDGEVFCEAFDISEIGNFEGKSIPNLPAPLDEVTARFGMTREALGEVIARCRARLLEARSKRVVPGRDDKVLVAWNGLMISAFAVGYQVTREAVYLEAAARSASFILDRMTQPDGRLYHGYKDGRATHNAYLDDYAGLMNGLIDLYESDFDRAWLTQAEALADLTVAQFWDDEGDAFFYTGADHETLIVRSKNPYDNATPSGNSLTCLAFLRLAALLGRDDLLERAERTIRRFQPYVEEAPNGFAQMVCAADYALAGCTEVTVADGEGRDALVEAVHARWVPRRVIAAGPDPSLPLTRDRTAVDGAAAAYVCRHQVCSAPVVRADDLAALLAGGPSGAV